MIILTVHGAHASNQAQCIAVPDQKAKWVLPLTSSKIMSPEIEPSSCGHRRSKIGLVDVSSIVQRRSRSTPEHTIASPTNKMNKLAVNHPCVAKSSQLSALTNVRLVPYPNHANWTCRQRERECRRDRGYQAHNTKCNREHLQRGILSAEFLLVAHTG
jgi:hypothetical protein